MSFSKAFTALLCAIVCSALLFGAGGRLSAEDDDPAQRFQADRKAGYGRLYLDQGRRALDRGSYLAAIRFLNQAAAKGGGPETFKLRAEARFLTGDAQAAVDDLRIYLRTEPTDADARVLLGSALLFLNDTPAAADAFRRALDADPDSYGARVGLGSICVTLELYDLAVHHFLKAVENNPAAVEARRDLGLACLLAGRPDCALTHLRQAPARQSDPAERRNLERLIARARAASAETQPVEPDRAEVNRQIEARILDAALGDASPDRRERISTEAPTEAGRPERDSTPSESTAALKKRWNQSLSKSWETTYRGVRIRLRVRREGPRFYGVMTLDSPIGGEDVYHFSGTAKDGNIYAEHPDGHAFRGRLTDDRLVGVVKTRDGRTIPIDMAAP